MILTKIIKKKLLLMQIIIHCCYW